MDWSLPSDLQEKYEKILARTKQLQEELGIKPRTIEERALSYEQRKIEEERRQEEIKILQQRINLSRPLPKWKI